MDIVDNLTRLKEDKWLCQMVIESPTATEAEKHAARQRLDVLQSMLYQLVMNPGAVLN